jgi:hypothetical protein
MKYQEALAQRELVIDDLPKSQQKKITELEKLVDKIREIEADVDDESREEFEAIKSQADQADDELVAFIEKFDVQKAREQRARLAEMRNRIKKPAEVVPTPAPVSTPESKPRVALEGSGSVEVGNYGSLSGTTTSTAQHVPPVLENEQSISQHIQQLKKEAQISPDDFNDDSELEIEHHFESQVHEQEPVEVEAEEEFEKQGERKPRKVNIPLVVMGVGALLLTWGAVNFFKERR